VIRGIKSNRFIIIYPVQRDDHSVINLEGQVEEISNTSKGFSWGRLSMNISKFVTLLVFLILIKCILISPPCSSAESPQIKKEYTFGVVPQAPPEVMHRNWLPFIDRLSHDTGLSLKLKVYENMNDFEDNLKEGSIDFTYMNPVQAIMAWNESGYIPLVRSKNLFRGIIFVRKDSGIQELNDLEGKEIALVGSKNVCSIVIRHDVKAMKVASQYVGSSSNVYRNVEIGETAAGGTLDIVFARDASQLNQEFNTIYTTEPLSPHPISALPSVSAEARRLVIEAVLKYSEDKNSQDLLERIWMQDPVEANYDKDYKPLEQRLIGNSESGH
jgi:phosphonate transport system substrate-binding protein